MRQIRPKSLLILLSLFLLISNVSNAKMTHLNAFKKRYPNAKALHKCSVCHSSGKELNPYGTDFGAKEHDFDKIEKIDSDADTYLNIDEIIAGTWPGDNASAPTPAPSPSPAPASGTEEF